LKNVYSLFTDNYSADYDGGDEEVANVLLSIS